MIDLSNIGKRGNLLAILIPGLFVFFNIGFGVESLTQCFQDKSNNILLLGKSIGVLSAAIYIILILCVGYLIGVLLRLSRCEFPDRLSAWYLLLIHKAYKREIPEHLNEKFPYIGWLGQISKECYPEKAYDFWRDKWEPRKTDDGNPPFFNFCKIILYSIDPKIAEECESAESMNRYISGMFYGLLLSSLIAFSVIILQAVIDKNIAYDWITVLIAYSLAIFLIIKNFRTMRIRETAIIFTATFNNRDRLPF